MASSETNFDGGGAFAAFAHEPLSVVPLSWKQFSEAIGLRGVELRGQDGDGWWVSFWPSPDAVHFGPPFETESLGYHTIHAIPSPAFVFGSKLGRFIATANSRDDAGWFFARVPSAVLGQATRDGDELATPACLGELITALLDRSSLLIDLVLEGRAHWAKEIESTVGLTPELVENDPQVRLFVAPHGAGIPTIEPRLTIDWINRLRPDAVQRKKLDEIDAEHPFVLNELLAKTLETIGPAGARLATGLREKQAAYRADPNPYARWIPWVRLLSSEGLPGPPAIRWLCEAVWYDIVRPKVERARKNPAAMVRVVASQALGLLAYQPPRPRSEGQQSIVFPQDSGWSLAPSIDTELLVAVLRGTGDLSSEVAIDLFEWLITTAHRQYVDATGDFRTLVIEGGWSELARLLGVTRSGSAEKVRALALAFAHLRYDLRGWRGNLLTYAETRAAPGRKACVKLTLGDMLLQGFTFTLKEASGSVGLQAREDRQLVPILGKAAVVGSPASYAAQRRMTWALATMLRSRAVELSREGWVTLSPHDWADLANKAGAPRSPTLLGKVQAAWEEGDESKAIPPLIVRSGSMVTLHESRKPALDFIKQAGETSQRQSDRGRKGVRARSRATNGKKPA